MNGKYVNLCGKKDETCDYNTFKGLLKGIVMADPQGFCDRTTEEVTIQTEWSIALIIFKCEL